MSRVKVFIALTYVALSMTGFPIAAASAATDYSITPPSVDPGIAAMVREVSAQRLKAVDAQLVSFGTRNAFSERLRGPRGVVAARDWIASQFREIAQTSGGRMSVALQTYTQPKTDFTPRAVSISSVVATLHGDVQGAATYVISSHYDSRASDGNDPQADAPGADDNGSGTSCVLEAARILATRHFPATIIFAAYDGEEQGLFGSSYHAKTLHAEGVDVEADLNNDIIGASIGHGGEQTPYEVRLFSEALQHGADTRQVNATGSENDSPSRELARFVKDIAEAYVPDMHAGLIYRADRFLRGGDQESFAEQGYPAVRFVEVDENFDHQHQNVRVENQIQYGDLMRFMDFDYLARVTQMNLAALASLAAGPSKPKGVDVLVRTLGYDTTLRWRPVARATSYEIVWRRTDEAMWSHARDVGNVTSATIPLSKDNWLFGVRALDAQGHRSVVSFPAPARG